MIINVYKSSRKVPVIHVRFLLCSYFLDTFSKNTHVPNFTKIRSMGADLFHADRQTDMTKLTVAFRDIVKVPNN